MALLRVGLILFVCLVWAVPGRAQVTSSEYKVKAAFLLNFLKFVQWPDSAFSSADAPYGIGIWGDDPFGENLVDTVRGKSIGGRAVFVRKVEQTSDLADCHLVFISRSERSRLKSLLRDLKRTPLLTVSETEDFAKLGGMINFKLQYDKVRFEINPKAAASVGLRINSKLLSVATIVSDAATEE